MRPKSHRDQYIPRSCVNCRFSVYVDRHECLLCFHGEMRLVQIEEKDVFFKDKSLSIMDGVEFSKNVWASRVVDGITGTCDNWRVEE